MIDFPKISLGTCTMMGQLGRGESLELLDAAYDRGIRFLDTAEGYPTIMRPATHGWTEELLGEWLNTRGHKDVLVNTKVFGPGNIFRGGRTTLHRAEVRHALNDSLERLKRGYVDCYMLHTSPSDPETITSVVGSMREFLREGKIRSWGLSNCPYETYAAYCDEADLTYVPHPVFVQNRYAYGTDSYGVEEANVPLMAYGVLRYGSFSGKYKNHTYSQRDRLPWLRDNFGWDVSHLMESDAVDEVLAMGVDPIQFALKYVLDKPFTKNAILGVTTVEQLDHALSTPGVRDILS